MLLTVHYTNPGSLIPIIPAYCNVVNHSRDGKHKSFHLSLCSARIIAASAPQQHSHGPSRAAQETGSAVLDTLICSHSKRAPAWQQREGPRAHLPWLPRQAQWMIRPLQPPPVEPLSCFLWASVAKCCGILRFEPLPAHPRPRPHPLPTLKICFEPSSDNLLQDVQIPAALRVQRRSA